MATIRTKGLSFPLELSSGKHVIADSEDSITSSLMIILSWPIFTRDYEDSFGSRIHEILEDPNDDILVTILRRFVIDAITTWEKRIRLTKLSFNRPDNTKIIVDLNYLIHDINIEDTLRYTFYTN